MNTETLSILANYFNVSIDYLLGNSDIRNPEQQIDPEKLDIGLNLKDYTPPTEEQKKKIEEFAKFVLQENKKSNKNKG